MKRFLPVLFLLMLQQIVAAQCTPPTITTQPTNRTACATATTSLTVAATGSNTLTYQWYKGTTAISNGATGNGSTVSGATNATLTFSNTTTADAATNYNVQVSSGTGCTVTSSNASLTVNTLPRFTAQPSSNPSGGICTGGQVTFSANFTGVSSASPSSIQWLTASGTALNVGPTGSGSTVTVLTQTATSASITISNVSPADNTNYYLRLTSQVGCGAETSSPVALAVAPPSLPTATTSGTKNIDAYNYVITNGSCNLIAAALPSGSSQTYGNTSATVTIDPSVQTAPNGRPSVQRRYSITPPSNPSGTTATVTLYFTQAEFTAFNTATSESNLPVDAADAAGNKANIRVLQVRPNGTQETIDPADNNIVWNSTYNYWQVTFPVTGLGSFYLQSVPCNVTTTTPANATTCLGSTASFTTTTSGTGPFTYQWYKGTTTLSNGTTSNGSTISGATSATLTIANATAADAANNYNVQVTSGAGCMVTSGNATLTVNPVPQIASQPGSVSGICEGSSASFSVSGSSPGSASFQWYKGTTALSDGATGTGSTISGANFFTLTISNVSVADNATNYYLKVISSNGCSTNTNNASLTVNPAPAKPVITAGGPTSFCAGGSVTLTAPTGAASYAWSNGATTQSITVTQSGRYAVRVANASGCTATSDTTVVTVNAVPDKPVISANGATTFCAGGSVTLSAPTGFATYAWSNGATTPSILVNQSGSYTVMVTSSAGCSSPASDAVTVTVNPVPAKPVVTASGPLIFNTGDSVILTAPAGFANYVWSNGATTRSIVAKTAGTYTVVVTNREGCSSPASDPVTISIYTQPVIFVSVPGAGNGSGLNWNNALHGNQISARMSTITSSSQFWVKTGTYYPTQYPDGCGNCNSDRDKAYLLRNNVALYGGFAGTESGLQQRNIVANPTLLSGDIGTPAAGSDNSYHVVIAVGNDSTARLDGFTITNGNASGYGNIYVNGQTINQSSGGGVFNAVTNPVIANCTISNNGASSSGGGMNNASASPTIRNTTFSGNNSSFDGGAINNVSSSPSITYSRFVSNTAAANGGGIQNTNSAPMIANSNFLKNTAYAGGGIANNNSSPTIVSAAFSENNSLYGGAISNAYSPGIAVTNSVFASNSARQGGAIYNNASSPTITNSTFYAANPSGSWSIYSSNASPIITNSIIWSSGGAGMENPGGSPQITYSTVPGIASGSGNISQYPMFINEAAPAGADGVFGTADDGLKLAMGSPAIDKGNNAAIPAGITTDITGAARIQNGTVDMGSYEGGVGILPLTLLQFSGNKAAEHSILLSWRTANEVNVSHFELERSTDGRQFATLVTLQAKGNALSTTNYSHEDGLLTPGVYYYRLKMVDKNGRETWSQVVAVTIGGRTSIALFPVPAKEVIWLSSGGSLMGTKAQLMDVQGKVLQVITISNATQRIDIAMLPAGTYFVKTSTGTTVSFIKK